MLQDAERLALEAVAVVGLGAALAMLANTQLYPVVLGMEIIALIYAAGQGAIGPEAKQLNAFLRKYFP